MNPGGTQLLGLLRVRRTDDAICGSVTSRPRQAGRAMDEKSSFVIHCTFIKIRTTEQTCRRDTDGSDQSSHSTSNRYTNQSTISPHNKHSRQRARRRRGPPGAQGQGRRRAEEGRRWRRGGERGRRSVAATAHVLGQAAPHLHRFSIHTHAERCIAVKTG